MTLYSDPPPLRPFSETKPTLLVCWWITSFCAVLIALRVIGRLIRTEKLFREDRTAALALVPLFLRMACVHVVLVYGTNNAQLEGAGLSDEELHKKSVASGLVLLSRLLYAATLWTLKYAILEFFKRLNVNWRRTYDLALVFLRAALITTFIAVVISDLAECQPFSHYWQTLPDPGGQCRQGYAQLLTMAICNIITDLSLVILPVPVILSSSMSAKRKFHLVLLFSLSLAPVAVTIYRVPHIFDVHGSQQARSLYASVELLFATAAANALVLGSFVRDRGVKKRRFKYDSVAAAGSVDRSSASDSRRPTATALRHWGSDEDLVRGVGYAVKPELRNARPRSPTDHPQYIPAPVVAPPPRDIHSWRFPGGHNQPGMAPGECDLGGSDLAAAAAAAARRSGSSGTHRRVSFFDYGGLLSSDKPAATPPDAVIGSSSESAASPTTVVPEPAVPASGSGFRRGSAALLQDLGGFLSPTTSRQARPKLKGRKSSGGELSPSSGMGGTSSPPVQLPREMPSEQELELMDVGGLLESKKG